MEQNKPQEIDLLELFSKMFNGIGNFFKKLILGFYYLLTKYIFMFIGAAVIGLALSWVLIPDPDKSHAVLASFKSQIENKNEVTTIVNKLNDHIRDENFSYLSNRMEIPLSEIKKLTRIEVFYKTLNEAEISEFKEFKKSVKDPKYLVEVKDIEPEMLYTIQVKSNGEIKGDLLIKAITNYFGSNVYVKRYFKVTKKLLIEEKSIIKNQLSQINQYQNKVLKDDKNRSVRIVDNQVLVSNQETFDSKVISLNNRLMEVSKKLEMNEPIMFFSSFSKKEFSTVGFTFDLSYKFLLLAFVLAIGIEALLWMKRETRKNS
jgi:hypothetical protein